MQNRLKKNESTLCTYTICGSEIKEGDILGYGDNYPCVVIYNKWEARFEAVEFGYKEDGDIFRTHDVNCYTIPWEILGNIDENPEMLQETPAEDFDYNLFISMYYRKP